ncbi:MAG: glycosyl transferase family 51, partial [Gemmatimonadota bacterium]
AVIERMPEAGERVLAREIVATVRQALIDVVERGSGRRVRGAFADSAGNELSIGGKTGTGDHRYERYGAGGQVIESRVVNRTATFAFFIDDRFFGVMTAYVHGPEAAKYRFTSALPVQLLKTLAPALRPLLEPSRVHTARASTVSAL